MGAGDDAKSEPKKKIFLGSINKRLLLGFFEIISLMIILSFLFITLTDGEFTSMAGQRSVELSRETIDSIDEMIYLETSLMQVYAHVFSLRDAVSESNEEFSSNPDVGSYLENNKLLWESKNESFILSISDNALTKELKSRIQFEEENYGGEIFGDVLVTNKFGAIIAQTNPEDSKYYLGNETWWGETKRGEVYVSDFIYSEKKGVYVIIAVPVLGENDEFLGAMMSEVYADYIFEPLDLLKRNEKSVIFAHVVDSSGKIIYSTEDLPYGESIFSEGYSKDLFVVSDGYLVLQNAGELSGDFVAHSHSRGFREYAGSGLVLIIQQDSAQMSYFINRLTSLVSVILFLVLLFSVSTSILVSRSVSKPIEELSKAAEELEKGNFSYRLNMPNSGEFGGLAGAFNKAAEALEKIEDERKEVDSAKTQFLTITSHELRSPMTPMKANLQMLKEGYFGNLAKNQKESLEIVIRNADHLDKILADFLDISRIEAARLQFTFKKTDLNLIVNEVCNYMKGFMPEKKVRIIKNTTHLPSIEVDPDRLTQVLRNLVGNAIKFSPEGGKVTISATVSESHVLFGVRDEGQGMSTEQQKRLFEPFYQVDKTFSRKVGGTGLGLAICKGIVESQGGKIWVESSLGVGSEFHFTVPFTPIKELKAIKVLFTPKAQIEAKVENLLIETLGPVGREELDYLKREGGLLEGSMIRYIDELVRQGILKKEKADEFSQKIVEIFGNRSINDRVKDLFITMLGNKGEEMYEKIGSNLTEKKVITQIDYAKENKLLNEDSYKYFISKVSKMFGHEQNVNSKGNSFKEGFLSKLLRK